MITTPQTAGRPLRITHVITRLIVGGAQENTIATVLGLHARGLSVQLLSGPTYGSEGSLETEFLDYPELLTVVPSLVRPVRPIQDVRALAALRREFRRARPGIVHTHSGKAGIIGRWAAHAEKTPIIIHGIHGPSFGPWQGSIPNAIFRTAEQTAGRLTTHFVAVANAMIDQYLAVGIGHRENYTRIFSGFPLPPFLNASNDPALRASLGIGPEDLVIGKIARLFELKGHEDLFAIAPEFVRRFPRARFLLVGGGPWEDRFKQLAVSLRLERNFIFTGVAPPARVPALAGLMDVLVHLSRREGLPRALPQAMAAGKPVVAYECDGAGEVCLNGETGFLIPSRDRNGLFTALAALAQDQSLRARLGAQGREFVRERFSVERMVSDTHKLYVRLLQERGLDADAAFLHLS